MVSETIKRGVAAAGLETLKDDMKQLADDFREVIQTIGEKGKDVIIEGGQRAGASLKSWSDIAKDKVSDVYNRVSEPGKVVMEKSRTKIASRPFTYVLGALAAGIAIGAVLKRI